MGNLFDSNLIGMKVITASGQEYETQLPSEEIFSIVKRLADNSYSYVRMDNGHGFYYHILKDFIVSFEVMNELD